jgi:hypothetical protein
MLFFVLFFHFLKQRMIRQRKTFAISKMRKRKRDKGGIVLLALMCRVGGPLLPGGEGGRGGGVIQELKSSPESPVLRAIRGLAAL